MTTTTTPEVTGKAHPACELLPRMAEKEFRELQRDIGRYGLRHPIIVDEEGTILDGRHRYQAVVRLPGTDLKVEVFRGTEAEKAALVMSENIHRRHLTTDQRAAIAADLATLGRGGDRGNQYTGGKVSNDPLATSEEPATTIAQAAEVMNVSVPSVKRARAIKAKDPAAHEAAKRGDKPKSSKAPKARATPAPKAAPKPKRIDDLLVMMRELDAAWPKQLDVGDLPSVRRTGLIDTVRRLLERLSALDAAVVDEGGEGWLDGHDREASWKWLDEVRIPLYEEKLAEVERMLSWPRNAVMTRDEYNAVLKCLHPDSLTSRTEEQLAEAFRIFTKYKAKMASNEETRKLSPDLPRTRAELLARKKGKAA